MELVTTPFPFLNQEDYFTNLYSLFLEPEENDTVPKKRTKLENEPPLFSINCYSPSLDEEELEKNNNNNNNIMVNDFFEFDKYEQTGPGSEPDSSPGNSTGTFNFHSLVGSSGHIHFQEPPEPYQVRNKRSRSETVYQTEPVPVQTGHQRRLWVKNRSKAWWEEVNRADYPESEFIKAFKMSRATFELVCDELDAAVFKKDTMLRQAIPVRQRVAVCIYRLATGEPLRLVSKKFGLGISTCHKLVLEVCSAMKTVLMPKYIRWPVGPEDMEKTKKGFNNVSGLPNVAGAIYTTHIPIIAPKVSVSAYFNKRHTERNQKTSYTITVQGVVGPDGVFNDVCIGWPGSMPDDKILEKSALYQRAVKGGLKDGYIVGNSNFQLTDWVLTPYVGPLRTWAQHGFNEKVDLVQNVAKGAFERLKGRWGCLQKRTEVKLQDLPVVLGACCVLHNICEMRGEEVSIGDVAFEVFDDEVATEVGPRSVAAVKTRDQIAHRLLHHNFGSGL